MVHTMSGIEDDVLEFYGGVTVDWNLVKLGGFYDPQMNIQQIFIKY